MQEEPAPHSPTVHDPWLLHPLTRRQIRTKAGQLIGRFGFTGQDRQDLEQELMAMLVARFSRYDGRRASRRTYVSRLLDRCVATIIKAREASMRHWRNTVCSLSQMVPGEEGTSVEYFELLEEDGLLTAGNDGGRTPHEALALRLDLERVMASLPEREREACELLRVLRPEAAARHMGMSHTTFHTLMRKVRKQFAAAQLKNYL